MIRSDYSTSPGWARMLLTTADGPAWFEFGPPLELCETYDLTEVRSTLARVDDLTRGGLHAVGFVAYEASSAFDSALVTRPPVPGLPLVRFAIYGERREATSPAPAVGREGAEHGEWRPATSEAEHRRSVEAVRRHIERGETYQANLTFPFVREGVSDSKAQFADLLSRQFVPHAAYLDAGRWAVCSASPELFFRRDGEYLVTRPMKGTAPRAPGGFEDLVRRQALANSVKDRAENLMIVDMLRNDLGRIADPGSVSVRDLYRIERYATVWQMTSTVEATSSATLLEVFDALFPCASITGAPKASSMGIISQLETSPRGIYTGAVGWVGPNQQAEFNVAIRTAVVDRDHATATYGVGGGIVWDSDPAGEHREALAKAATFSTPPLPPFQLLESLLWRPGKGYWLLSRHLDRLLASAEYFAWSAPTAATLRDRLQKLAATLPLRRHKVRVRLDREGDVVLEAHEIPRRSPGPCRLGLAPRPETIDPRLLCHKTTVRVLDTVWERADGSSREESSYDDILMWDEDGNLTESTWANVVVALDGQRHTPSLHHGLLPGVLRQHLIDRGEIVEASLTVEDLKRAEGLWLINSVRGWIPARLEASRT
ncbi:MAG: aminodeoxychorismate synthase component I [Thermoanaerobaculia bacterium]|nr:aminodeoxychorismate synthase component I [Thermoanaerobaculia bacterium]